LDRDHIIDPLGDFQHSQDITLSDIQQSFSFGDWEAMGTEQGLRLEQGGVEMGRRENEPGYDETSFTLDNLDPLKDMNINDDDGGGGIDFDFDLGDGNDDMRFDNNDNNEFEMGDTSINESQIDTLMQIGIMPVVYVFDIQEPQSTPRRKKLVVDKVTEIPHDDLRKYMENPSLLTDKVK
jgi:hypothetical protein